MSPGYTEELIAAFREDLAERIKMAMGATHPEILSGRFLSELADVAAGEALEFFHIREEVKEVPVTGAERYFADRSNDPAYKEAYDSACERLRRLVPWG